MGTRLYPVGLKSEQLEQLAGVPAGTAVRLEAYEKTEPAMNDHEAMEIWYDGLFADEDMRSLHHFLMNGFHKLTDASCDIIREMDADYNSGATCDPVRVRELLQAQGADETALKIVVAVSWN